jgi:hypothetical protein
LDENTASCTGVAASEAGSVIADPAIETSELANVVGFVALLGTGTEQTVGTGTRRMKANAVGSGVDTDVDSAKECINAIQIFVALLSKSVRRRAEYYSQCNEGGRRPRKCG